MLAQQSSSPSQGGDGATRKTQAAPAKDEKSITEEELKRQFAGKAVYLRNGYFENSLHFTEEGVLEGSSPEAPYTLSMIQIDKVHLTKHRLELQGVRYGLHFLGEGPSEDALATADKVRITPKKKAVTITIQRAMVQSPKKQKTSKHKKGAEAAPSPSQEDAEATGPSEGGTPGQSTIFHTQARANQELREAIDHVFSSGLDERMVASLPDFWQRYFKTASGKDAGPADAGTLHQSAVDRKARLLSTFEPASNEFAQMAGVAGMAQYHVVVGPDGKAAEISVGRPIGFGLDENAVDSIRKASFEPAIKDGKPVSVLLDLVVQFRIYSKRTAATGTTESTAAAQDGAPLPGPYTVRQSVPEAPKQP